MFGSARGLVNLTRVRNRASSSSSDGGSNTRVIVVVGSGGRGTRQW